VAVALRSGGKDGSFSAAAEAVNSVPAGCNFGWYKSRLMAALSREHEAVARAAAAVAAQEAQDVAAVGRECAKRIDEIRSRYGDGSTAAPGASQVAESIMAQLGCVEPPAGAIRVGIPSLDRLVYRLMPGEVVVVGARPSCGKTALALQLAINYVLNGGRACMFALEMSARQLGSRVLANIARTDTRKLMRCPEELNECERAHIGQFREHLREVMRQLDVCDDARIGLSGLRKYAHASVARGAGLLVLDYLQLLQIEGRTKNGTREQEIASVSREFKVLCRELRVPGLLLSQLSRANDQQGRAPRLSDLRESGAIEQDADVVWLLHDPSAEKGRPPPAGDREVHVIQAKGRDVGVGFARLMFWTSWQMFGDCEARDEGAA
jgi:replicative DNA helicase